MEEVAIRALLKALLMCGVMFEGPQPDLAELKAFEFKDGGIRMQTLDWEQRLSQKTIEFINGTIKDANLQMVMNGDEIELGGQVKITKNEEFPVYCPVAGDTNEIRIVTVIDDCGADFHVYRIQDKLYGIANTAEKYTYIFDLGGNRLETKEIPVKVDGNLGVNQDRKTYVYKDNDGRCQEVSVGPLNPPWKPVPCDDKKIILVPNQGSEWYHVQYLQVVYNCQLDPVIPQDELKNFYVRFLHGNEALINTTTTNSTEKVGDWPMWSIGLGIAGGVVVVILVGIGLVLCLKRKAIVARWRKLRAEEPKLKHQKAEKIKKLQSDPGATVPDDKEDKEDSLRPEEDSDGNMDESLMTVNPLDVMPMMRLVPQNAFLESVFVVALPKCIDLEFVGCKYYHVKELGHGDFGTVHQYKTASGVLVAVKFLPTNDPHELNNAKQEFMLIRKIQRMIGKESHLSEVIAGGQCSAYTFTVSPFYELDMSRACNGVLKRVTYPQKLNAAYQMLLGILDLQGLGYSHNNVKPSNYMQNKMNENKIVLCDFGLVKKFGSKRKPGMGTPCFMSTSALKGDNVSMVDDMTSWFYVYCMVVCGTLPYVAPPWDKYVSYDLRVDKLLKAQEEGVPKFPTHFENREIIGQLREMIWNKPPGNTIDMKAVLKALEDLQTKFDFKYTDPWWDEKKAEEKKPKGPQESNTKSAKEKLEMSTQRLEGEEPVQDELEVEFGPEMVESEKPSAKPTKKKAAEKKPEEKKAEEKKAKEKKAKGKKAKGKKA